VSQSFMAAQDEQHQRALAEGRGFHPIVADGNCQVVPVGGPVRLPIKVLPNGEGLPLPAQATDQSVGLDLRAATEGGYMAEYTWRIEPGEQHTIPTGIAVAIPEGYAGLVPSRSGLAHRCQVAVTNSPGVIDPDYRGEIHIMLENRGQEPFHYKRGDRLAQLVIVPAPRVELMQVLDLDDTDRGAGGLGSTGVAG
jgi:dUTP pyrophosphatase